MASYNKVILMGNLTRDPKLSYLPSNTPVVEISLAINHKWKTQDGQQREDVCFIDCNSFGRQAETINQYLRKGQPILIEGRLQLDRWEGQDGSKHSKHRVHIDRFTFVGGGQQGGGYNAPQGAAPPQQQQQGYAPPPQQQAPPAEPPAAQAPPPSSYDDQAGGEDIPF
ncbi:MAG: single-stranded DNA-binding protein [Planctomycetota bacterium]|nr:MAG: single-stranded DNA-binding protein [Planctomycetota bacterium]